MNLERLKSLFEAGVNVAITASTKEYIAVQNQFEPLKNTEEIITSKCLGNECTIGAVANIPFILIKVSEQGSIHPKSGSFVLQDVCKDLCVKSVFVLGICYSMQSFVMPGDVVISASVGLYENAMIENGQSKVKKSINKDKECERIAEKFIGYAKSKLGYNLHFGLFVSGDKLVNDSSFKKFLHSVYEDALAGDMESAGISSVCNRLSMPFFIVKCVSDMAEGDKSHISGDYSQYADSAAKVFYSLVECEEVRTCIEASSNIDFYNKIMILEGEAIKPYYQLNLQELVAAEYPRKKSDFYTASEDAEKIHYEYARVDVLSSCDTGYLLFGKHIAIRKSVQHFLDRKYLPTKKLFVLSPRVTSTISGGSEFRIGEIEKVFSRLLSKQTAALKYSFIEDYVWEIMSDDASKLQRADLHITRYYIDQPLYREGDAEDIVSNGVNKMFDMLVNEQPISKPVLAVVGEAGIGKSTFCKKLVNKINSEKKRVAVYLANDTHEWPKPEKPISSVSDLYKYITVNLLKKEYVDIQYFLCSLRCGNIIVVVDGIDEIHSALGNDFLLSEFIDSIVSLNNSFGKCRIVVAARDYYKESLNNPEHIAMYSLKGFSKDVAHRYFDIRCESEGGQMAITKFKNAAFVILSKIVPNGPWNPLYVDLVAEIVNRTDSDDVGYNGRYLRADEHIDQLILDLLTRENKKQKLSASIDDVIEILLFVCVTCNGRVKKDDLISAIQVQLFGQVNAPAHELENYIKSPFLYLDGDEVCFKYSLVDSVLRARLVNFIVISGSPKRLELRDIMASVFRGKCETLGYMKSYRLSDNQKMLSVMHEAYSYYCSQIRDNVQNESLYRKAISGLIRLAIESSSAATKMQRSDILKVLCGNPAFYFSVYGEFVAIDFTNFTIADGCIVDAVELFRSEFPERKCFMNTKIELPINTIIRIPHNVFDLDCSLSRAVKEAVESLENTKVKIKDAIKDSLVSVTKTLYDSGEFVAHSRNIMKSKSHISVFNISFPRFIDGLVETGWITFFREGVNELYCISEVSKDAAHRLIVEGITTKQSRTVIKKLAAILT